MQNAFLPIQHLDRPPVEVGGLCYFYFTPVENVLQWPVINPLSGSITDDIVLKNGKGWMRCNVIDKGRSYSESQKEAEAGSYIEMAVTGFLPGDAPNNRYSVNLMRHRRFAVVMKERNGIMRLMGDRYSGAAFTHSYTSADANGSRGRNLTFNWKSQDTAPLYLTAVSADGDIINPPWVPPSNPGGSGRMVYDPIFVKPTNNLSNYTDAKLLGKSLILIAVPPVVMYPGELQTQFTFTSSTGTVVFHNPLRPGQNAIIIYADPI